MDADSSKLLFTSFLHVTGLLANAAVTLQTLNRSMQTGIVEDTFGDQLLELGTQIEKGLQAAAGGSVGPILCLRGARSRVVRTTDRAKRYDACTQSVHESRRWE
jgi:hypothetical protein